MYARQQDYLRFLISILAPVNVNSLWKSLEFHHICIASSKLKGRQLPPAPHTRRSQGCAHSLVSLAPVAEPDSDHLFLQPESGCYAGHVVGRRLGLTKKLGFQRVLGHGTDGCTTFASSVHHSWLMKNYDLKVTFVQIILFNNTRHRYQTIE